MKTLLTTIVLTIASTMTYAADIQVKTYEDTGQELIHVVGDIEEGDAEKLFRTIIRNPSVTIVELHSSGGLVAEGLGYGFTYS